MTTTAAQQTLKPVPGPSRMKLDAVVRGKQVQPVRAVMYGPEGCGKSTFGANAPSPIFLGAEDGTAQLDVVRFPSPQSWQDILDAVRVLTNETHDYKTLVIDTLDWVEPLVWKTVCQKAGATSIEEVGGGYGKGYVAAVDEWRTLLAGLERLRTKGVHVILLAHSWIRPFKNPQGDDFDRYELKLHAKSSGLIKEWADAVLFANYETFAVKDKSKRVRGVDTGARLIYTERRAAYDAKNRYGLPETLPLSWAEFDAAMKSGQTASPDALKGEIARKAKQLGGELEKTILATLAKAGENAQQLAQINNRVNARLAELAEAQTTETTTEKGN